MDRLMSFNAYCKREAIPLRFSILKEFSFEYLIEITDRIKEAMSRQCVEEKHGKGQRKHPLQRYLEGYHMSYGEYPKKTPADAGYGSYDNYSYCQEHGIGLYMKYSGYRKEQEKPSDKNRFKIYRMKPNEEGKILCPAGHAFTLEWEKTNTKGRYPKTVKYYRNEHCEGCPFRSQCTRSKHGRTLMYTRKLDMYQKEVKENLETVEGKELMKQRRIQSEGIFGQIKQDYEYDRLWRRGETGVKLEILLVSMGHNLRRYHNRKQRSKVNIQA